MKISLLLLSFLAMLFATAANFVLIRTVHAGPEGSFKPCDKISAADVQPFFKATVKKKASESNFDGTSWNCNFDVTADNGPTLQILVAADAAAQMFTGSKPPTDDGKPEVALAGIGDKAIRESNDVRVCAQQGAMFCMIHADHSYARAGNVEFMRGLNLADSRAGKIPAAAAQTLAEALGTLCNRAFGSGNTTPSFANLPQS